eukprot:g34386.t1
MRAHSGDNINAKSLELVKEETCQVIRTQRTAADQTSARPQSRPQGLCGNEFHRFTILRQKKFLLISVPKGHPFTLGLCCWVRVPLTSGNIFSMFTLSQDSQYS